MAVPASGTVSLDDIQTEFGGANPVSLSEYYRDGTYVTSNNTGVPTSGAVSVSDFYGAVKQFIFTITANTQEADLATLATAAGWDGVAPIAATIDSGVYLWSDDVAVGGLAVASVPTGTTVDNYGYIIGRGGDGGFRTIAPQSGGPALINSVVGITINNMSGGYIAGGGGGGAGSLDYGGDDQGHGGGGAGGGDGGGTLSGRQGGTGGAIGASGTNGGGSNGTGGGVGGTAGAAGGGGTGSNGGGGGGGGRILPGSTAAFVDVGSATGGDGGAGGVVGGAGEQLGGSGNGGGGGGGWGAAGGAAYSRSGGAAGAAISGTAVTLTNSGTVYGATA
jgi:hypothetical protein